MTCPFLSPVLRHVAPLLLAAFSAAALSAELEAPKPIGAPATKAYRQIMPDGRIVYSDKRIEGAKIDETIEVDPPVKGNIWSTEPGERPVIPPQTKQTPVERVTSIPGPGKRNTLAEAEAEVNRAEMLLEEARKRQKAGTAPLPGERTGNASGGSRLNDAYKARQKSLAQNADEAEAALKKSIAERDALQNAR